MTIIQSSGKDSNPLVINSGAFLALKFTLINDLQFAKACSSIF